MLDKLHFDCLYCPATYPDLKGLIGHFEREHRQGEYVVIELPKELIYGERSTNEFNRPHQEGLMDNQPSPRQATD